MNCVISGHAFEVVRYVRDIEERSSIKKYIECRECGEEYTDYEDESEIVHKELIEDFEDDDEKIIYFILKALKDIGIKDSPKVVSLMEDEIAEQFDDSENVTYENVRQVASYLMDLGYLKNDQ